jgi:hypothetical protein
MSCRRFSSGCLFALRQDVAHEVENVSIADSGLPVECATQSGLGKSTELTISETIQPRQETQRIQSRGGRDTRG